ncbi:hypothetical protein PRZ48_012684 [Zasmidium cellare]|uniref:Uncharacterized protein n=1 Tax=Zasmidium cellare TaxID=395010 RepID=A0ABR0E650_ZASCE|nr:hypothetical protein PRZ48_012684 [Zasmidium cellare]
MSHDDCAVAWFGSNLGHFDSDSWIVSRLAGACGEPHDIGSSCVIQGGPARLYYFPVDTTEGCAANGTSATTHGPTNTTSAPPQPVTTLGTTFDPGSAYISFETLYAAYRSYQSAGGSAIQIGPTFSNTILALRSDEVSTNCYGRIGTQTSTAGWGNGKSLNYADLNLPVPASAYQCANQCVPYVTSERTGSDGLQTFDTTSITPNPCETIWNNFNPLLAIPTRLKTISEWASCSFCNDWIANVVFDPPTALRQATAEAKPTLGPPPGASPTNGGGSVTTPARPASTASPDGPANTAVTLPRQHSDSPSPASPTANTPTEDPATVPALADSTTGGQQSPSASPKSQQNPSPQPQSQQPASPSNSPANDPSPQPQSQQPASPSNEAPNDPSKATDSLAPNTAPVAFQGQSQNAASQGQPAATNSPAQSEQQGTTIGFNTPASGAQTPQDTPQGTASPGPQASPASQAPAAVFTVGGNTMTAQQLSNNHVAVGGTTIPVGQGATLSNGAVLSVASNGIVVNSAPAAEPSVSPVFVAGSITASPVAGTTNAAVINGVTLTQGGSAVSTNGQVISFGSSGLQAVSGGQTQMFSAVNDAASQSGNVLIAGSITASPIAGSSSAVVVNGATLSAGGSAIVTNGQTISYGSSGLQMVSAGHTQAFSAMGPVTAVALPTNVPGSPEVPLITLNGAVYSGTPITVSGTTGWKIGSQTLLHGSEVTLSDGEVATLSGSSLLVEKPTTTTSSAGVGDAIADYECNDNRIVPDVNYRIKYLDAVFRGSEGREC